MLRESLEDNRSHAVLHGKNTEILNVSETCIVWIQNNQKKNPIFVSFYFHLSWFQILFRTLFFKTLVHGLLSPAETVRPARSWQDRFPQFFFFFFFCIYRWAPLQSNTPKSKLVFIRSDLTLLYISHVLICALNSKFAYFRLFSEKMNFFRNRFLPITWWKDNDFHFTSVNPGWLIFFWNVIAAETFADMLLCLSFQEWLQEVKNIGGGCRITDWSSCTNWYFVHKEWTKWHQGSQDKVPRRNVSLSKKPRCVATLVKSSLDGRFHLITVNCSEQKDISTWRRLSIPISRTWVKKRGCWVWLSVLYTR